MRFPQVKLALWRTYNDVQNKHTLQMAAGLSYYFVLSLFPQSNITFPLGCLIT